jgi:hypothetical protein
VFDRGGDQTRAGAAGGIPRPSRPSAQGGRAAGGEAERLGGDAEAFGEHGAGLVEQAPGLAALGVQAPGVGPASLPRGGHRLASRRVDGPLRGVEDARGSAGSGRNEGYATS